MIIYSCLTALLFLSCVSDNNSQAAGKSQEPKLCALTFDDGPDVDLTPLVLDKLEKHNVVATFMLIGQLVNDYTAPVVQRAAAMGCEFGIHSWGWESMDNMTPEEIRQSVGDTAAVIKQYTGTEPHFFRPPNLATCTTQSTIPF